MLTLTNLSFRADQHEIISNITASFPEGSFTVITGPNGGGKSTLARLIMGIEQPTAGTIHWNGTDITKFSISERSKLKIGYAFQQPPRFKGMSVKKLLTLAHGKPLTHEQCCEYLSAVGLCANDYLDRDVDQSLSGGEVKRIEIATLWFKSTDYGDDKDRVMRKADGTYTYFIPDVAYHLAKFERGHSRAINIQGTDHFGTIARVRAGIQAASGAYGYTIPKDFPE